VHSRPIIAFECTRPIGTNRLLSLFGGPAGWLTASNTSAHPNHLIVIDLRFIERDLGKHGYRVVEPSTGESV
jgi:hypothetical protein